MADYSSAYPQYNAGQVATDIGSVALPTIGNALMTSGNPYAMVGGMALSGLGALVKGMQQKKAQGKLNDLIKNRPVATTPQEVIENKQNAQQMASGALGNATNQQAINNINQQGANSLNAMRSSARSSTDLIAGLSNLNQNQNNAFNNLALQNYGQRVQGMNALGSANQALAGYRDRNFEYNVNQPYNQAVQSLLAQTQAGNQNINTAQANVDNYNNQANYYKLAQQMYGGGNSGTGGMNQFLMPQGGINMPSGGSINSGNFGMFANNQSAPITQAPSVMPSSYSGRGGIKMPSGKISSSNFGMFSE